MTSQQRNERIAEKVLGWLKVNREYEWLYADPKDPNGAIRHIPNFAEDPSTMHLIVEGLRKLGCQITFYRDRVKAQPFEFCELITREHSSRVGYADIPHAALITAIEEWIEETPDDTD